MNNFLKKYWLKITDKTKHEETKILKRIEKEKKIFQSKFVIANSSIAFPIAEGLKVPRLLEACPYFPAAQPHGANAFDFYFQTHFEKWFKHLYYLK